jgi:hypothetical protein
LRALRDSVNISEGREGAILRRAGEAAQQMVERVVVEVAASEVIGSGETSVRAKAQMICASTGISTGCKKKNFCASRYLVPGSFSIAGREKTPCLQWKRRQGQG